MAPGTMARRPTLLSSLSYLVPVPPPPAADKPTTSPANSRANVPGSGTAETAEALLTIGEAITEEPNNWLAPSPTFKLDPLGRPVGLSTITVPACTFVLPA